MHVPLHKRNFLGNHIPSPDGRLLVHCKQAHPISRKGHRLEHPHRSIIRNLQCLHASPVVGNPQDPRRRRRKGNPHNKVWHALRKQIPLGHNHKLGGVLVVPCPHVPTSLPVRRKCKLPAKVQLKQAHVPAAVCHGAHNHLCVCIQHAIQTRIKHCHARLDLPDHCHAAAIIVVRKNFGPPGKGLQIKVERIDVCP